MSENTTDERAWVQAVDEEVVVSDSYGWRDVVAKVLDGGGYIVTKRARVGPPADAGEPESGHGTNGERTAGDLERQALTGAAAAFV